MVRIAVIDRDLCKPKECSLECIRFCPLVRTGTKAIEFDEASGRPVIREQLCLGCGICIKKCPFKAISIVNLPEELERYCVHRYGPNGFKLFRLPTPKEGKVLGIIGLNGVGKTTSLMILSGKLQPNLGRLEEPPTWEEIIRFFRGSALQNYFDALSKGKLRAVLKPQHVNLLPKLIKGTVGKVLEVADERGLVDYVRDLLGLEALWDRSLSNLSGGELQRLAIAITFCKDAHVYMFDEPSSFLDVYQRLKVARIIRDLAKEGKTVIVVEHDLAMLDYVSDMVCVIYGEPGVYGIVSLPRGVGPGINEYLDGYLPGENMRIRSYSISFNLRPLERMWSPDEVLLTWSSMSKRLGGFQLIVESGTVHKGEVIGVLGPNGIGKTTFMRLLIGELEPDEGTPPVTRLLSLSYKPQYISSDVEGTVRQFLEERGSPDALSSWFRSEVLRPLRVDKLLDRQVSELSGGELQATYIAACLAKTADVYLIDEPMAYLDVEQRLEVSRIIRRLTQEREVAAFVVEHDILAHDFVADSIMIFEGTPGFKGHALPPMRLKDGMNVFLKNMGITFRRDKRSGRPRVNKEDSYLDRYQKSIGEYYFIE